MTLSDIATIITEIIKLVLKSQCGSWVRNGSSGQNHAQSGKGPGHVTAAMLYVKSRTESKRMKFNLMLSTPTFRNTSSKQATWTLMRTKSINEALLTCATKTHVPDLPMKFMKNLTVEDNSQVTRFSSCIWKESYQ